jgi:hypothetical protein
MRLQLADVQRAEGLLKLQIQVLADKAGHRTSRPSPESSEEVMSDKELIAELLAALREIESLQPQPFDGIPADWHEQIAACDECQGWAKHHTIQQGICNTHRRPLWDREHHNASEATALGPRAMLIARSAIRKAEQHGGE